MSTLFDRLDSTINRFRELDDLLSDPNLANDYAQIQAIAKERAALEAFATVHENYNRIHLQLGEASRLAKETDDEELKQLAEEEVASLKEQVSALEKQLRELLVAKDPNDDKDVIVEIRAGTGGEEAALFAGELYRMYAKYAQNKGWDVDIIDSNATGIGGFKEIVFEIKGSGVHNRLKYESGGHRVQRIPVTETGGRIHTSAATVAILPAAEDIEIKVDTNDLRIDVFHSGGHGGQNVQKVATAIRITHLPTGIVATCQDERSQLKNKQRAMSVLRARILDRETTRQQEEVAQARRSQVGKGDRSEKIRTYNYPQNRVTDHRSGITSHNLDRILTGELEEFLDNLINQERVERLQEALQ